MSSSSEVGTSTEPRKLYVLVREDLPPGLRAAQAAHAVADICLRFGLRDAETWRREGNFLIILGVKDTETVVNEHFRLGVEEGIPSALFNEPDLDYEATAVAFLPSIEQNALFADFPLAYSRSVPKWRAKLIRHLGGFA